MPIYEFKCNNCGLDFEELVSGCNSVDKVTCPACAAKDLKRKFSVFAGAGRDHSGSSSSPSGSGCSSCRSGHCNTCH